ncbi:4-amino-4-deoxychorismate lyase [Paenibacillus albiflavus]|uniref:4-amino-4-deoxychorismate lyase n=1 Tax=Paenibacillus albiflavus TaxID=2545760 RepID=A0A4R4E438_9BACL|nr:aminodeoxychorismate lyase [Paenibacillus albiflavus]TCZ74344.1 4-amino-4-deoxychorismate lyase [Paenibacillus albiflavus]
MIISLNGLLVEDKDAVVSVYDHGFLYGMGLFETFRTYNGQPFLLDKHMERLTRSCAELGIAFEPNIEKLSKQVSELLLANDLMDGYFRYTITAGVSILGLPGEESYEQPTEIIYVKALPERNDNLYVLGKPLQLLKHARNTPEGIYRLKSLHYMNNILAKRELASYPWAAGAEGLMLTEEGYISEGIVSNVFYVREGILYTPSLDTGCLPGVTREFVIGLAKQLGIVAQEGLYTWNDLVNSDEIFVTNSIQEIVPISSMYLPDGKKIEVGRSTDRSLDRQTERFISQYRQSIGSVI